MLGCLAAVDYDYPWDRCIAEFKFGGQPGLARALAELMRHAPGIEQALEQADWVVPMPLADARLRSRGYNQSHELARRLHPRRTDPHVLLRLRATAPQVTLDAAQRQSNLIGSMQVHPQQLGRVQGRRIVVLDDIMTTGASLHEASRALLAAGAREVVGLVLARAHLR